MTLRRMPGVKRKERGKTQPVRFEVPQEPEVTEEAKGQSEGQGQGQGEGQSKDDTDGSSAKRFARHTRSHSTPNMPALEEALSATSQSQNGAEEEVKGVLSENFRASIYHMCGRKLLPFCTMRNAACFPAPMLKLKQISLRSLLKMFSERVTYPPGDCAAVV